MTECEYCANEPEPGWMETSNNGPIVPCPLCNFDGKRPRESRSLSRYADAVGMEI